MTTARRRARYRKGEGQRLRGEILDVTERLLLDAGSSGAVSIREVADAVGVSPPSIYRHFPDKAALISEVCSRYFVTLDGELAAAEAGIADPVEALVAMARTYVDFGRRHPEPYRAMFLTHEDAIPERFQGRRLDDVPALGRALRRATAAIAGGRFRGEHGDPARVAVALWARLHGLTALLVTKPELPWPGPDFVDHYVAGCLQGLLVDPAPQPPASQPPTISPPASQPPASDPPTIPPRGETTP